MSRVPKKVKQYISNTLGVYKESDSLELFDILHLYDTGKYCLPDNSGYWDAKHFELVGYNTKEKQFRKLGRHDSINFTCEQSPIDMMRIFADGATLVRFKHPVPFIHTTQAVYYEYSKDVAY